MWNELKNNFAFAILLGWALSVYLPHQFKIAGVTIHWVIICIAVLVLLVAAKHLYIKFIQFTIKIIKNNL